MIGIPIAFRENPALSIAAANIREPDFLCFKKLGF